MDSAPATPNVVFAKETLDVDFIDRMMRACYDAIRTDQFSELVSSSVVVGDPNFRFIEVSHNNTACGLVVLVKNELHTMFVPPLRGRLAINAMKCVLDFIWKSTQFSEVRSYAYSHQPHVAKFAAMMGFKPTASYDDGSTIDGKPVTRTDFVYQKS